jgi:hypothetical protein
MENISSPIKEGSRGGREGGRERRAGEKVVVGRAKRRQSIFLYSFFCDVILCAVGCVMVLVVLVCAS